MKPNGLRAALTCTFGVAVVILMFVSSAGAAEKYKVLHYFMNQPASSPQAALLSDSAGNLYGTTRFSSTGCQCGAVFKLTAESDGRGSYHVIHLFRGPDGATPVGSLILDSSGNLYGTTEYGGAHGNGTVFELSPSGSKWTEKVLYSFGATSDDLKAPLAALTFDRSGNLYGTASSGGPHVVQGGVFELKPSGNRWEETVIYNFTGGHDGGVPMGNLVWDSAGNLYSTAFNGGDTGSGVVFELSPSSGGSWTESVLYAFAGGEDGEGPQSGVVFDALGNLYGTTYFNSLESGAVFELTPSIGSWTLSLPYTFCQKVGCEDGASPVAGLVIDSAGNLYGTTEQGGTDGDGVVFKLSQSGNQWTESVVHSFDGTHGGGPNAALILDKQILFGTTGFGGVNGNGVVFGLTAGGVHVSLHKND
jgi:uncharacterized repeat protein (TIGR03803 family)